MYGLHSTRMAYTVYTTMCFFHWKKKTHFMWSVVATLRRSVLVPEAFGPLRQTWIQTKWTCPRIFLKQQRKGNCGHCSILMYTVKGRPRGHIPGFIPWMVKTWIQMGPTLCHPQTSGSRGSQDEFRVHITPVCIDKISGHCSNGTLIMPTEAGFRTVEPHPNNYGCQGCFFSAQGQL